MAAAVELSGLSFTYPSKGKTPPRPALRDVTFSADLGASLAVLGPNGGGKSTLFRILATAFPPTAGKASVLGLDLASSAAALRPRIGVVFQSPSLDPRLTVRENMRTQGHLYGLSGQELERRIRELLDRYRLSDRGAELAGSLSGGLKRRVELAKGLLHSPELLLLDEPSTGLDPGARKDLWEHLRELKSGGKLTILVTTHLMDEAELCDAVVILDKGTVVARGTPASLKSAIGGDVITIESAEAETLRSAIRQRFGLEAAAVDGSLRLERENGHSLIPQLVEAFPGMVRSVSLSKPSLEDVFIHHTGHRFWEERRA